MLTMKRASLSMRRLAVFSAAFFWSLSSVAEESAPEDFEGVSGLANVMLSLIVVLAVVFGVAWIMKRMQGFTGGRNPHMKVVAQLPLSTRERLMLVDVGGQQLVLGVSPGGIRTLHVLDEPVAEPPNADQGASFRDRLMESMGRGGPQA